MDVCPEMPEWMSAVGKDPDAGEDWRQEKGTAEEEMVGWHHWLNGHEFEQALGVGEGQGSLACCSPWGHKESDTTERLNNSNTEQRNWLCDQALSLLQASSEDLVLGWGFPKGFWTWHSGLRFSKTKFSTNKERSENPGPNLEPAKGKHWSTVKWFY